jgi:phosphatidylserine decarboxylase
MPGHYMKIPLAKEGYVFFVPVGIIALALAALSFYWAATVFFLLFLFIVNFFRDPNRIVPQEKNAIISPADGKIVEIVEENDPFMNQPSTRVSVFLNVFDVHVNRVPIGGRIEKLTYNKGKFLNAASPKASLDNEQTALLIDNGRHKVVVKQIAGLIARRIVCWAKVGDEFKSGERFGLIRFGSRTDIFVPQGSRVTVSLGDRVAGGADIIGYLPE